MPLKEYSACLLCHICHIIAFHIIADIVRLYLINLVGPLPISKEGYQYLFTMVDRTSRWFEAVPTVTMEAEACAGALINTWVSHFGVPVHITSDQGRQFTSNLWDHACKALGIHQGTTTVLPRYHHGLSPTVQRYGRGNPPTSERRPEGPPSRRRMAPATLVVTPGLPHSPQRRQRNIIGRAGLQSPVGPHSPAHL